MKKTRFSLLYKLLLVVIFIMLPVIITFVHSYRQNREHIRLNVLEELTVIAETYEGQVYQFLEMSKRMAENFASDGFISDSLEGLAKGSRPRAHSLYNHLVQHKKPLDKSIRSIHVIGVDGVVVSSTDKGMIGKDVSNEPYFTRGIAETNVTERAPVNGSKPMLAISTPVKTMRTGKRIGVLVNLISLSDLYKVLSGEFVRDLGALSWGTGQHETMEAYIVNSDKLMITESIFVEPAVLKQKVATLPVDACLGSRKEVSAFYVDYRGVEVAGASMCIPSMGWTLLVEEDASEALASVSDMRKDAVIAASVVAMLVIASLMIFFRSVVLRLKRLALAAEDIAKGDYDTKVPIETADEVGTLSDAFNRMAYDIKKRTALLAESEERLKEAQRIGRIGNWNWDIASNKLYWSDEIYSIFGQTPHEFDATYETFLATVHPEDLEYVKSSVNNALYEGKDYSIDHRIVKPDGTERVVHEQAGVIFDESGRPVRMAGTVQDVTESKKEEKERLKLQSRLEDLMNNISSGVYRTDTDGVGRFVDANAAMVAILEADSKEELLGRGVVELYQDRGRFKELAHRLSVDGFIKDEEILLRTLKKKDIWVSSSAVINIDKDGAVYVDGVMEDITDKKRLEEQLIHAQRMEAVGQLAGGIAHDFNNILTAVNGYANLLVMRAPEKGVFSDYAENILTLSDKAASLTQGLLAFSRKQVLKMQPADLNELVKRIGKILKRVIGEQIEFRTELFDNDIIVTLDTNQIEQVLMNLATNARDAMPGGGVITITTGDEIIDTEFIEERGYGTPGRYGVIKFTDTGTGVDAEIREKIFEPFFSTKEVGKGTGLGLSMVYGIIKQHNGFIDLASEPGKGTVFTIHLPIAELGAKEESSRVIEKPQRGTEKVLLAEDEPEVRDIIKTVLEEFGYSVVEAADGEEAVARFIENKEAVNLLILDVIMPRKGGQEAFDEIRPLKDGVKALFISGYATDRMREVGAIRENMEFLTKPIVPSVLLKRVREVLDK